jgi:hypothetical protein
VKIKIEDSDLSCNQKNNLDPIYNVGEKRKSCEIEESHNKKLKIKEEFAVLEEYDENEQVGKKLQKIIAPESKLCILIRIVKYNDEPMYHFKIDEKVYVYGLQLGFGPEEQEKNRRLRSSF